MLRAARGLATRARDSPLRGLVEGACAGGEAARGEGELQWSTQPYVGGAAEGGARGAGAPNDATVLLFPGQGAHHVGMGRALQHVPAARQLYELASHVLGWDVWEVCTSGPPEELASRAQTCVVVTSLAGLERAREERPGAVEAARAAAGYSLGELAALVWARALRLEDMLRVLAVREEAMRAAAAARPGDLLAVWPSPDARLSAALRAARDHAAELGAAGPVCQVAVYMGPGCKVVGGDEAALRYLEREGRAWGLRRTSRVGAGGAWHTPLVSGAESPVREALRLVEVCAPRATVVSCVSGRVLRSAREVSRDVSRLCAAPVRWEQTLHALYARPHTLQMPLTLSLGPGRALRSSLRQVNARAWDRSVQVDV